MDSEGEEWDVIKGAIKLISYNLSLVAGGRESFLKERKFDHIDWSDSELQIPR